jgi:site-specific recombinase XerD
VERYPYHQLLRRRYAGPLGRHIRGFTLYLRREGFASESASDYVWVAANLNQWIERQGLRLSSLRQQDLTDYVNGRREQTHGRVVGGLRRLFDYLRQRRLLAPDGPRTADIRARGFIRGNSTADNGPLRRWIIPETQIEHDFEDYMLRERGVAVQTAEDYLHYVRKFVTEYRARSALRWSLLTAKWIARYVLNHAHDHGPGSAKGMVKSLRNFFRFLYLRQETAADLSQCVPYTTNWRQCALPKFLQPAEVRRLLRRCDRRTSVGRRDYAILLLIARLGLRAGEVRNLALEDFDWRAGTVVVRGKGSQVQCLPLPRDVGEAISEYIKIDRPRCWSRAVFLRTHKTPAAFAAASCISAVVARHLRDAGLAPPRSGAHVLRHSLATRLLGRGATLAEIGDLLGHRNPQTTTIYAKVDLRRLRSLADRWPGGAI